MNREKMERWILLQDAGELGAVRAWWLRRALRSDEALRAFQADLASLSSAMQQGMPEVRVADSTLRSIQSVAQSHLDRNRFDEPATPLVLRPAFAMALLALLLTAGYLVLREPDAKAPVAQVGPKAVVPEMDAAIAWDDGLDSALTEMQVSLASSGDDWATTSSSDTDAVVEELLALEESQI